MSKKALFVWGGWDGHTPKESCEVLAPLMQKAGFEVEISATLDSYLDKDKMMSLSLIVQSVTGGPLSGDQEKGLMTAVDSGVGLAGWHGGMCDSFRENTNYQFMTGGQWVAHPGNLIDYKVNITAYRDHEITRGINDFEMKNTEQYYMHVDPSNNVLATTTFAHNGCVMPVIWTRTWGKGRVFYTSLGHNHHDFKNPDALETTRRGLIWAAR